MATAKTKEVAVTTTEEPVEEKVTVDDVDFVEKVTAIVRDLLKTNGPPTKEGEEPTAESEPEKRLTLRDQEEQTRSLVAEAIANFKKEAPADAGSTKEVASETVPGAVTVRKIEKWLWGKE